MKLFSFFWKSQEFCLAKGHSRGHVELSLHERCWFDWHFYTNFLNFSDSAQKYSVGEVEKNSCSFFTTKQFSLKNCCLKFNKHTKKKKRKKYGHCKKNYAKSRALLLCLCIPHWRNFMANFSGKSKGGRNITLSGLMICNKNRQENCISNFLVEVFYCNFRQRKCLVFVKGKRLWHHPQQQ